MSKQIASEQSWYSVKNQGDSCEIKIYGQIHPYAESDGAVSYNRFQNELRLALQNNSNVTVRIHSSGGSMFDGLPIFDLMKNCTAEVTTIVEGMAASMSAILTQAASAGKRKMWKHARLMIHKPHGGSFGESEEMRSYADLLDSLEENITDILCKSTGKSKKVVKTWFKPNSEKWITASEALKLGLCDEVLEDEGKEVVPENAWEEETPEGVWGIVNQATNPIDNTNNSNMKKETLEVLNSLNVEHNLTEKSSDSDFAQVVKNALSAKESVIADLNKKLKDQNEAQVKNLIDSAVNSGKITEAQRPTYTKLAEQDFESTSSILNEMKGRVDINGNLNKGGTPSGNAPSVEGVPANRKDWDYKKWEREDPTGLMTLKKDHPDAFNELIKQAYGEDAVTA